jgi:hypothetical protein
MNTLLWSFGIKNKIIFEKKKLCVTANDLVGCELKNTGLNSCFDGINNKLDTSLLVK